MTRRSPLPQNIIDFIRILSDNSIPKGQRDTVASLLESVHADTGKALQAYKKASAPVKKKVKLP